MENHLIITKPSVISALVQHRENHYFFGKHCHSSMEIYHILSGQCKMDINNATICCEPDDIIVIMPNTVHSFYLDNDESCEFAHIHFVSEFFTNFHLPVNDTISTDLIAVSMMLNIFYFQTHADPVLSSLISSVISYAQQPGKIARAYENLHLTEILLYILEKSSYHLPSQNPSAAKNKYVSYTLSYIHKNYANKILISDISNALNISSRYLSKIFFEQMNVTIANYINIHRINCAIDLMLNSPSSLTEISAQIGLKDSQHFSKLFHTIIGISPLKYKKLIQNTE